MVTRTVASAVSLTPTRRAWRSALALLALLVAASAIPGSLAAKVSPEPPAASSGMTVVGVDARQVDTALAEVEAAVARWPRIARDLAIHDAVIRRLEATFHAVRGAARETRDEPTRRTR